MSELFAIQTDVAASLRDAGASARATRWLKGDATLAQQRLGLYRANVAASIAKALTAAYPAVRQVVGDEFFEGLARAFQRMTLSTSGDLYDYGAEFSAFLREFPHAQALPYLPDLARLEWAAHRAYGARDATPWDTSALISIPPERHAMIRFAWAPGIAIVDSPFPVARIWAIHQPGYDGDFNVDWSVAECALVARDGFRVTVTVLGPADTAFMACSLADGTLGAAVGVALEADPRFDLGRVLARAVASNLICGFTTDEDE